MLKILLLSVTIVVLIWFGFAALAYYDVFKYENGFAVIEVEEIEQTEQIDGGFSN